MPAADYQDKMVSYHKQIVDLRTKMRDLRAAQGGEPVKDYVFASDKGEVKLSELFGDKRTLIVIHNMGKSCTYCMLWADGFNGVLQHLENRASFVVSSPDTLEVQRAFAKTRGWNFKMVSLGNNDFAADMGYHDEKGWHPGVSVFKKTDDGIERAATSSFGPGDDYCSIWHLFDLIPEGADGWQPQYGY